MAKFFWFLSIAGEPEILGEAGWQNANKSNPAALAEVNGAMELVKVQARAILDKARQKANIGPDLRNLGREELLRVWEAINEVQIEARRKSEP